MKFDYFTNTYIKIASTDLMYLIWVILFVAATSTFPALNAPAFLSRPNKVMFYAFSAMYGVEDNPDYRAVAITAMAFLGFSKLFYASTWWKRSKIMMVLMVVQGLSIAFLAILNGDVCHKCHRFFTNLGVGMTAILGIVMCFWKKDMKLATQFFLGLIVCALITSAIVVSTAYNVHSRECKKAIKNYDEFLQTAAFMAYGYSEWAGILIVIGIDYLVNSWSLEWCYKTI